MIWVPQTVDKGARALTGASKFVSKPNKFIRKKGRGTVSNRTSVAMLAVFFGLDVSVYAYRPKKTASVILSRRSASLSKK